MFYNLLYPLHTEFSFLNVFRYITVRTFSAIPTAFFISLLLGPYLIRAQRYLQIGQMIRGDGPQSHNRKSGTPTMGGAVILGAVVLSTLLWADLFNRYIWIALFTFIVFGLVGLLDDYLKYRGKNSRGLAPRFKFALQFFFAFLIGLFLYYTPAYSTRLSVPFFKTVTPDLGWFYVPFALIVVVGASNAVNLTDGLDGLAIVPMTISASAYGIVSYVSGHKKFAEYLLIPHIEGSGELAVFCGTLVGAGLGFLWFNAYPASLFMGDVGSLSLGAALGTVAVISKHELLLILVGGVFVIEALSVIFQVASYKMRKKRVFLMAPLHHHFELKGWEEPKIVIRFWIISIILALLSLLTLKLR